MIVKFNPLDKSWTEIGPDLGEGTLNGSGHVVSEPTVAASNARLLTSNTYLKSIPTMVQPVETLDTR